MNKPIECSPFQLLLFSFVLITSCTGQDNKNLPGANPYQQQYNNLHGKWALVSSDNEGTDTLALFEDGRYFLKANMSEDSGQWKIINVHHMSLGDADYRFYFNRENLVLEDKKGNQYEYKNTSQNSGQSPGYLNGQLSQFIRRIFQDRSGNLWFGTNGDGVIRYDGERLEYFSLKEGFGGVAVRGIVEDAAGNVWFGTDGGLTRYDGKSFTNFTEKDGLINKDVWSLEIDHKGIIWIGTLQGISCFNGKVFTPFVIPASEPDYTRGVTSARIVHSIMEDSQGRMWFGTSGGAYIYDGKSLSNISEQDGLCNNSVNCILEDRKGTIWFATHHQGICRWDGLSFTNITEQEGVNGTEAWDLYEDRSSNIWFPMEHFGVYRYDGKSFVNFHNGEGLASDAIQCTFEDKEGRLWVGGYKGLFRFDGKSFFPVTTEGPWEE